MLDECARERFREANGSGRRRRCARVRRRAVAGKVEMPECRQHKGDGFEGKAGGHCTGSGRRRVGSRHLAAAKHAARRHVLLVRVATGNLGRTLMGADDVAEGIDLRSIRAGAEGEGAKHRLEQQQIGRGECDRYAPSSPPDLQKRPLHATAQIPSTRSTAGKSPNHSCGNAARSEALRPPASGIEVKSVWRADFRCLRQAASTLPRSRDFSAAI